MRYTVNMSFQVFMTSRKDSCLISCGRVRTEVPLNHKLKSLKLRSEDILSRMIKHRLRQHILSRIKHWLRQKIRKRRLFNNQRLAVIQMLKLQQ